MGFPSPESTFPGVYFQGRAVSFMEGIFVVVFFSRGMKYYPQLYKVRVFLFISQLLPTYMYIDIMTSFYKPYSKASSTTESRNLFYQSRMTHGNNLRSELCRGSNNNV